MIWVTNITITLSSSLIVTFLGQSKDAAMQSLRGGALESVFKQHLHNHKRNLLEFPTYICQLKHLSCELVLAGHYPPSLLATPLCIVDSLAFHTSKAYA